MVDMLYTSQRISFLRQVLEVLDTDVRQERARLDAVDRSSMSEGELLVLGDWYVELHGQVEGLGHKMLIVGLSSLVESSFGIMLKQNAPTLHPGDDCDWGAVRKSVDKMHGVDMGTLHGWAHVKLVRLLSNCFKHADGFALAKSPSGKKLKSWAAANHSASVGFDWSRHVAVKSCKIDFGALPVSTYIDHVETFLNELENLPVVCTS